MLRLNFLAAAMIAACLPVGFHAFSQDAEDPAAGNDAQSAEKEYLTIANPVMIERNHETYRQKDVQLADRFEGQVSEQAYNGLLRRGDRERLRREGFSPRTHHVFSTHSVTGSNMLCFASRESEEANAFFEQDLVSEMPVYLMGRVGNRVFTEKGVMTLFVADRLAVGSAPPKAPAVEEKKTISFTIEYDVETATGTVRRRTPEGKIVIPESGKTYEIPDPYDRNRKLYMTFEF